MTSRHTSVVLAAARRLLDLAGSSVPIDVKRLAAVQGVASVRPVAMKEDARLVDFGRLEIEYRQFAAEARCRFSVCHELGHTLLMPAAEAARLKLAITSHLAVTVPDPEQEYLANVAAAELLMPLTQFRKHAAVPPSLDALIHLCHLFGASKAAVLNRIKETDTRWDCAALYWKPILGHGCVDGFRIARRVTFGRFQSKTFVPGTTSRLDGLFLSQRTGRRSSALYDGVTIESVGYGDGGQAGVWSLATNQSLHKRLQAS